MTRALLRDSELDATTWPELRDRILAHAGGTPELRAYPGVPRFPLPKCRPRRLVTLDGALRGRRTPRALGAAAPSRDALARLLAFAHGISGEQGRGPVPSAGGLQALELYLVALVDGWLAPGSYHYDRAGHHLSQLAAGATRESWEARVPALATVTGGAFLCLLVGDVPRVEARYGERAARFLLLEAGHLMQNLCLLGHGLRLGIVPLGGVLEAEVARELVLPRSDAVLYAAVCGPSID